MNNNQNKSLSNIPHLSRIIPGKNKQTQDSDSKLNKQIQQSSSKDQILLKKIVKIATSSLTSSQKIKQIKDQIKDELKAQEIKPAENRGVSIQKIKNNNHELLKIINNRDKTIKYLNDKLSKQKGQQQREMQEFLKKTFIRNANQIKEENFELVSENVIQNLTIEECRETIKQLSLSNSQLGRQNYHLKSKLFTIQEIILENEYQNKKQMMERKESKDRSQDESYIANISKNILQQINPILIDQTG